MRTKSHILEQWNVSIDNETYQLTLEKVLEHNEIGRCLRNFLKLYFWQKAGENEKNFELDEFTKKDRIIEFGNHRFFIRSYQHNSQVFYDLYMDGQLIY